jgi:CRP/FNR family transcriptional regulator, cyclic AMP receptor protein
VIENVPQVEQRLLLAEVDILQSLPSKEIERLAIRSASVHLGAGETFALDEERRALFLLASGRVRVHEPSAASPGLTISMVEHPTVLTQTGFAARPSRAVVVEALEPSVSRVLEGEDFEDLVHGNPEVGVKTISLLSERLVACEARLSDLVRKEVPARLASLILRLIQLQGITTANGSHMIPTRYTHQQFASMVGSNREAVTRAFRKLRDAGAVEIEGRRVYVTDEHVLERLASAER